MRNPKNNSFSQSSAEVEKLYAQAFDLYDKEKFEESKTMIEGALEKYPKDALVPKFSLLNAFNIGKTAGKEIMILQLEQIALNYAKTPEGEKAREMLKYLKSDLEIEKVDAEGNVINATAPPIPDNTQKEMQDSENSGAPVPPRGERKNRQPSSPQSAEMQIKKMETLEEVKVR